MDPEAGETTARRIAIMAGLLHLGWALATVLAHPGLSWEPDRVANRLYLDGLLSGAPRLADQWYFPAPKILGVALAALGPVGEGVAAALAAGLLAGCGTWIVARSAGAVASVVFALALGLDPWWRVLVSIASGDLFVAAGVAATAAAWEAGSTGMATTAVLLATLVKTPAAACIAPYVFDGRRAHAARGAILAAAIAGFAGTFAGFTALLGDRGVPFRFLSAYARIHADEAPGIPSWLARWIVGDVGGALGWAWPLALVGVAVVILDRRAAPQRRWVAGSVAVVAAFVALAVSTGTLLFSRFLWVAEVAAIALAASGSAATARWMASLAAEEGLRRRLGAVVTAGLGALLALGVASGRGEPVQFEVLFENGARTAVPWLSSLAGRIRAGDRLTVPLWFQPAAMSLLPQVRVEAAEVLAATGVPPDPSAARWLLLGPAFCEPAGARWLSDAARGGTMVESSHLPHMALVRSEGATITEPR